MKEPNKIVRTLKNVEVLPDVGTLWERTDDATTYIMSRINSEYVLISLYNGVCWTNLRELPLEAFGIDGIHGWAEVSKVILEVG